MIPSTHRFYSTFLLAGFLLVLASACKSTAQQRAAAVKLSQDYNLAAWSKLVNGALADLQQVYVEQPVFMNLEGPIELSASKYHQDYLDRYGTITVIYTKKRILARQERGYHYEVGGFTTAAQEEFKHLLILKQSGDTLRRELEFIGKVAPTDATLLAAIDQRRAEWMRLCNAHNAAQLVKNLYRSDAMYYNHKPLLIGHDAITQDYAYMNREQYTLKLTPIIVEPVNEQLVYEIGQCSGSYGGKYMLVWKKDAAGQWSLLMDSNI